MRMVSACMPRYAVAPISAGNSNAYAATSNQTYCHHATSLLYRSRVFVNGRYLDNWTLSAAGLSRPTAAARCYLNFTVNGHNPPYKTR
jgi:hypothetical protein